MGSCACGGAPGAGPLLDEARELALATGDIMRIGPMAAARAEVAWLGRQARMREEVQAAYELALKHPEPWRLGELGLWMWRAGALDRPPEAMAPPYRLEIRGDWQAAAAAWQQLGCPYEQALALAQGDRPAQLQALDILTGLGAPGRRACPAETARRGRAPHPARPARRDQGNPLGLTARQAEILRLLAGSLTNKEIAARLHISPKTVDHHVARCWRSSASPPASRRPAPRHPCLAPRTFAGIRDDNVELCSRCP